MYVAADDDAAARAVDGAGDCADAAVDAAAADAVVNDDAAPSDVCDVADPAAAFLDYAAAVLGLCTVGRLVISQVNTSEFGRLRSHSKSTKS